MTTLATSEIYDRLWGYQKPDMTETLYELRRLYNLSLNYRVLNHWVKVYKPCGACYNLKMNNYPTMTIHGRLGLPDYRKELVKKINEESGGATLQYNFYRLGQEKVVTYRDFLRDYKEKKPMVYFAIPIVEEEHGKMVFEKGMYIDEECEGRRYTGSDMLERAERAVPNFRYNKSDYYWKYLIVHRTRCFVTIQEYLYRIDDNKRVKEYNTPHLKKFKVTQNYEGREDFYWKGFNNPNLDNDEYQIVYFPKHFKVEPAGECCASGSAST